jgi:hypothetical protein
MDVDDLVSEFIHDAVHPRDHLSVLGEIHFGQFVRHRAALGKRLDCADELLDCLVTVVPGVQAKRLEYVLTQVFEILLGAFEKHHPHWASSLSRSANTSMASRKRPCSISRLPMASIFSIARFLPVLVSAHIHHHEFGFTVLGDQHGLAALLDVLHDLGVVLEVADWLDLGREFHGKLQ